MDRTQLLAPAGSFEKMKVAILYGADAVYMGTPDLSLRTKSKVSLDELEHAILYARDAGVAVHLALNLFAHEYDFERLEEALKLIGMYKPDALIVADFGIFSRVREVLPDIPLHVSTQANVTNSLAVKAWKKLGADLVILAREVSFSEMQMIRDACPDVKIESFVHGSMCMTYSGRCLLSNFLCERGANQGSCGNSCRWSYKLHLRLKDGNLQELKIDDSNRDLFEFLLEEEFRPGEMLPLEEDLRSSYILNSRDLCLMPKLPEVLSLGLHSLKIEGRGKSAYYVALSTRSYRMAIDDYYEHPESWDSEKYMRELWTLPNRGYTLAFHDGRLTNYAHNYDNPSSAASFNFAGIVLSVQKDGFIFEVKNALYSGSVLEFIIPRSDRIVALRCYSYTNSQTGEVTDCIFGSTGVSIFIAWSAFDREDMNFLHQFLVPYTVVRTEIVCSGQETLRSVADKVAYDVENGLPREGLYYKKAEAVRSTVNKEKTKDLLVAGCCGRGCNGCLPFRYDAKYEKARALLAQKRGEMLTKSEATIALSS